MSSINHKGVLISTYSEEELNQYVFDGFEEYYDHIAQIIEKKGFFGMKDYRYINELFIGSYEWWQHIQIIKNDHCYNMPYHIGEKDGRVITQKVKRLCNDILIDEITHYRYIIGTCIEDNLMKEVNKSMEKANCPEELIGDFEDFNYIEVYRRMRDKELRSMYWSPVSVYYLFSYLVEINGMEWIDFILNDAKMDCIEMSSRFEQVANNMLAYLDLCAEKVRLMNGKKIPRERKEYQSNEELDRIFHYNKRNIQKFLKNIQGLSGAAIVHRVKAAIEQNMLYVDDAQTPLYNALRELGYSVTSVQNWNSAMYSKKRVPLIE